MGVNATQAVNATNNKNASSTIKSKEMKSSVGPATGVTRAPVPKN
jgi:hypothetical protein